MLLACEVDYRKQAVQKLKVIPMSAKHRIEEMADDIENKVLKLQKN